MMNSNISTRKWQYAFILPIIAMTLMAFSFENYPVYNVQHVHQIANHNQDTLPVPQLDYPPIPAELEGQEIDTIITFDPATFEQRVEYAIHTPLTGIDTISSYNFDDFSETTIIVNHDTGQRDSIKRREFPKTGVDTIIIYEPTSYNPPSFEEIIITVNHDTGQRDTIKVE